MSLKKFIKTRPHLFWYVKDLDKISPEAALEQVLNYGDFKDVKMIEKIIGRKKAAVIFKRQAGLARCNYRPEIKNYFALYFKRYA